MKKIALPLIFLIAMGVASCSSNEKKPTTPQETASSVVSSVNNSANQSVNNFAKSASCGSAALVEKTISTSTVAAQGLATTALLGMNLASKDIQDNLKSYVQDVSQGKTSGAEYDIALAKAKLFCGDDWKSSGSK